MTLEPGNQSAPIVTVHRALSLLHNYVVHVVLSFLQVLLRSFFSTVGPQQLVYTIPLCKYITYKYYILIW